MNRQLYADMQGLSSAEKRSLGKALFVSADSEASAPLITTAQRAKLVARLAHHRANPDERGLTFV